MKESWIDKNGLPLIILLIIGVPFTVAMIGQYKLYKNQKDAKK